jgi:P4 family phage/plasmid primase-like protien
MWGRKVLVKMEVKKVNEQIETWFELTPLEVDEKISALSQESGKSKTIIKQQYNRLKKKHSKKLKNEEEKNKNFGGLDEFGKNIGDYFNKKSVVERIIDIQPVYYDEGRNWWLYDFKSYRWLRVDETDVLNAVERQASINTINSKEKNEFLEALKQVSRLNKPSRLLGTWIQFKDTLINVYTGEEQRASNINFVTNPIPWKVNEDGFRDTPTMDKIFEEWVGKENVQKLYEILAYCLLPKYPIHRIFCFIGAGMNGKSCFLNLLRKFIGDYNCCSTELDDLLNSRFEKTRLHKKLVCQMGETNFSEINKTSILKKLSGGDLIGFEYKNKDPIEDFNYAKILISTNNLPSTSDKTIGFYRRWMIIDFPNQFSEKKDILDDIPDDEYESLALKCTFILRDLLENRQFTNEGSIEDRMKTYEEYSNPLDKFLKEFTTEDGTAHIFKWEFEKRLNEWCKENRHREISNVGIGRKMKEWGISQQQIGTSRGGEVKYWRAWVGIKWRENDE